MFKTLAVLTVFLAIYVQVAPAYSTCSFTYRNTYYSWGCTFACCFDEPYCCVYAGSYWYAWTGISLFFLICLCACAGCGGYRYRRRYYYTRTSAPLATTVVTTANTASYQPAPVQPHPQGGYQPYTPPKSNAPPPYNPAAGEKPPAYNY